MSVVVIEMVEVHYGRDKEKRSNLAMNWIGLSGLVATHSVRADWRAGPRYFLNLLEVTNRR